MSWQTFYHEASQKTQKQIWYKWTWVQTNVGNGKRGKGLPFDKYFYMYMYYLHSWNRNKVEGKTEKHEYKQTRCISSTCTKRVSDLGSGFFLLAMQALQVTPQLMDQLILVVDLLKMEHYPSLSYLFFNIICSQMWKYKLQFATSLLAK